MNYKYSISCIFLAWTFCIIGLILGVCNSHQWFGRFGAVMVFFSVAAEYSLVQLQMKNLYDTIQEKSKYWHDHGWGDIEISKKHKYLAILVHVSVGAGTLVWGFGDYLLEKVIAV